MTSISSFAQACRVASIYSEDSDIRVNGRVSPIIIPECFPDETIFFSKWNESAFGNPPFYPAGKGRPYEYFIPLNLTTAEWKEEVTSSAVGCSR